ncbi:MAG: CCA tRNA nucleotidyltransferase [Clostridia bacterium]|nr:CCA tRNA nucleotidyltransferase [Clostridia bacterium]
MENKIDIPESLEKLANKLKTKGELFVVGGYVRNAILGIYGTDIDLCSKLTPDELKLALKNTDFVVKDKNKKLGTVTIEVGDEVFEHTTFRSEQYEQGGKHSPVIVSFVDDIREDAKRRDFTINSIYYSITKRKIIDIYSGLYDLEQKRIKTIETPDYVFGSDGLRILRMIRLACELDFSIEKQTFLTAKKMAYHLQDISGTRKQKELLAILDCETKYSVSKKNAHIRALMLFNKMQLWTSFYSSVSKIKLSMIKKVNASYLPALIIDMINSIDPDCVEYYLQYMLGAKGFSFSEKQRDYLINIVCGYFDALNKLNNKNYFFKYYDSFEKIGEFLSKKSRILFNKYNFFYKYIQNYHIPIRVKDLAVDGETIMKLKPKMPQKYIGVLLKELLDKVFTNEIENTKDDLCKEIKAYDYKSSKN